MSDPPDSPAPINDLIDQLRKLEAKIAAAAPEVLANINNEITAIKAKIAALLASV